ncbi:hypothetical protein [Kitasatospora sp. NBC_00458]|uniref:hypothetical protein n=1 Tax=Kitasatospora sp. NBC_00458 TaxID=2903568 RepID=UPI002E17CA05
MRTRRLALTAAAAVAVLAAAATACGPENSDSGSVAASPAATTAAPSATAPASAPATAAPVKSAAPSGKATEKPTDKATDKPAAGRNCGAKDLAFTAKAESQAGGFILISAKAKPGVTCTLPGAHAVIAFGSGGIEAANAEQAVGEPITLGGDKVAYAGVNPKSTKGNQAIEFTDVIVGIGSPDPDPVSLPVGPTKVDKPVVTNWHTAPKDAVPGV